MTKGYRCILCVVFVGLVNVSPFGTFQARPQAVRWFFADAGWLVPDSYMGFWWGRTRIRWANRAPRSRWVPCRRSESDQPARAERRYRCSAREAILPDSSGVLDFNERALV